MQEGDLADGPLPDILRLLAAARATGGVHVRRRDERGESADAVLFLREGRLYAATAPGPRPLLGVRLVAAGAVTREALEEALESQAGELAGWRLGELLVHLGYVDGEIVAEFVVEQILDTVAEVSAWTAGGWRFRRGEKTREADGLSLDIEDVLERVALRRQSWNDLEEYAGGATAVPQRVEVDEALTAQQIPLAQALLAEVDGVRTLAELATRCGLTTYEAGYVLAQLVEVGAVRLAARDGSPDHAAPTVARIVTAAPTPAGPVEDGPAEVEAAVAADEPVSEPLGRATDVAPPEPVAAPQPDQSEPVVAPQPDQSEPQPQSGSEQDPGPDPDGFDAEDPLGLADLLGSLSLEPEHGAALDAAPEETPDASEAEDRWTPARPALAAVPGPGLDEELESSGPATDAATDVDTDVDTDIDTDLETTDADDLSDLFGGDGEVDLAMQLAVLARQAEEARWAAEERRRAEVRARRATGSSTAPAAAAAEPAGPAPQLPIGLAPLSDEPAAWHGPAEADAPEPEPYEPIGLAPWEGEPAPAVPSYPTGEVVLAPEPFDDAEPDERSAPEDEPLGVERLDLATVPPEPGAAEPDEVAEPVEAEPVEVEPEEVAAPYEVAFAHDFLTAVDEDLHDAADDVPAAVPAADPALPPRVAGLPTRSAPAAPDPVVSELDGALADLRGAIDLAALDAPEPAGRTWTDPAEEPAALSDPDERTALQAALSEFGARDTTRSDDHGTADEAAPAAPYEAGPYETVPAWSPAEAHDFTPDEEEPSTDTAALLRELSFLGLEESPAASAPPPRPPAPRQAPVPAGKAKRKSIFGR